MIVLLLALTQPPDLWVHVQGRPHQPAFVIDGRDEHGPTLLSGNAMLRPHHANWIAYRDSTGQQIAKRVSSTFRRPPRYARGSEHLRCYALHDGNGVTAWAVTNWRPELK